MAPEVAIARNPEPAGEADILREQFEYLMEHAERSAQCGCSECQRFQRVRAALLEIFAEPPRARVMEKGPQLVRAA